MQIGHWFRYFFVVCCFWLLSAILDFCSFWLRFSHLWLTSYVPSLDAQLTDEVDFHPITSTPVKRGATVSLRGSIHLPQVLSLQLSRGARGIKAQSKGCRSFRLQVDSPTWSELFRLHIYTSVSLPCDQHLVYLTIYRSIVAIYIASFSY